MISSASPSGIRKSILVSPGIGDMRKQLREKLATRLGISNIGKDTVRYSVHQIKERSVRLSFCQYQRLLLFEHSQRPPNHVDVMTFGVDLDPFDGQLSGCNKRVNCYDIDLNLIFGLFFFSRKVRNLCCKLQSETGFALSSANCARNDLDIQASCSRCFAGIHGTGSGSKL